MRHDPRLAPAIPRHCFKCSVRAMNTYRTARNPPLMPSPPFPYDFHRCTNKPIHRRCHYRFWHRRCHWRFGTAVVVVGLAPPLSLSGWHRRCRLSGWHRRCRCLSGTAVVAVCLGRRCRCRSWHRRCRCRFDTAVAIFAARDTWNPPPMLERNDAMDSETHGAPETWCTVVLLRSCGQRGQEGWLVRSKHMAGRGERARLAGSTAALARRMAGGAAGDGPAAGRSGWGLGCRPAMDVAQLLSRCCS